MIEARDCLHGKQLHGKGTGGPWDSISQIWAISKGGQLHLGLCELKHS